MLGDRRASKRLACKWERAQQRAEALAGSLSGETTRRRRGEILSRGARMAGSELALVKSGNAAPSNASGSHRSVP